MRGEVYRVVLSVWLVATITVGWASRNKDDVPAAKKIYKELRWMQASLCLWQNWSMFAPAPSSSSWLRFTGTTTDGEKITLEPLEPEPKSGFFNWSYRRLNKLSISAQSAKRKGLHKGLAQYYCHQQAVDGVQLKSVKITRYKRSTLWPKQARMEHPPDQRDKLIEIGSFKCR
jgi:hypothetical protein